MSPSYGVRADLTRYTQSLRTCRNWMVHRSGGASNRAGLRFINEAATTSANVKLFRYISEVTGESVLIEAGVEYLRFYQGGALVTVDPGDVDDYDAGTDYIIGDLVLAGGDVFYAVAASTGESTSDTDFFYPLPDNGDGLFIYELPTIYTDPRATRVSQSGRVLTFTHASFAPYEVLFESLTRWVIQRVVTAPIAPAPTGLALAGTAGTRHFGYVVTAAAPETYEESLASGQAVDITAAAPTVDAPHSLTWDAMTVGGVACPEYYVYCDPTGNGTYGYIGTATGVTAFKNPGTTPDFTQTPPLARSLFAATDEYPGVSAVYQQRRIFAQTNNDTDAIFASRVGFRSNFSISSPLQDDDAITFKIAGNNHHPVRHLVDLKKLVALTDGGAFVIDSPTGESLTPNGIRADQETYVGCSHVPPVVIGNSIVYVQARGRVLREVKFDVQVEGLAGKDLSIFADHLFKEFKLLAIDYAFDPDSIVWAVRNDGTLLGLTYLPDQDVWGWHRHDTAGVFWDVCVVPETDGDSVYVIVAREIGGSTKYYIERLEQRTIHDFNLDAFFVDAGLTYDGDPATTILGLDHLEGQVVAVLADGSVVSNGDPTDLAIVANFTVTGGAITLPSAASRVHVGLAIRYADLETLDLDVTGSTLRDKRKNVRYVSLALERSSRTFLCGPDVDHLQPYKINPADGGAAQFTGLVELSQLSSFDQAGRVFIRHRDPLPITIIGIIPNVEVGG